MEKKVKRSEREQGKQNDVATRASMSWISATLKDSLLHVHEMDTVVLRVMTAPDTGRMTVTMGSEERKLFFFLDTPDALAKQQKRKRRGRRGRKTSGQT